MAVIGSGPGGHAAALTAARRGLRVGLIERGAVGGVCLNVGCIPTKALVAVAHLIRTLQRAGAMGVAVHGYDVDYPAVLARSERIITTLRRGITDLLRREGVELVNGGASFEGPHRLAVTREQQTQVVEAERIVLAVGARPLPGPWTFDEERLLSYRGLLSLPSPPRTLLVIGGGVIGCEFASCLSAFGTQVTIVEQQSQLLPTEDPDAVRWLTRRLASYGVAILAGVTVQRLERSPTEVTATLSNGALVKAERCVIAIGQQPNLESLRLPAAAVAHGRGVTVDAALRTSQSHIAAIGDCVDGHGLAHWASAEGAMAVRSLLGGPCEPLGADEVPWCVFADPEIARIGPVQSQAGERVRASRFSFGALGKSHCDEETEGFVKLLVEEGTDRVVGATIVGANASSLIHYAVLARRHGLTAKQLANTITAHPTMPEAITEAAASLYGESLCVAARATAETPRR